MVWYGSGSLTALFTLRNLICDSPQVCGSWLPHSKPLRESFPVCKVTFYEIWKIQAWTIWSLITETGTVDIGVNTHNSFGFDISAWIESPYQTPEWLQELYEPIDDPASELARQEALTDIFREDLTAPRPTKELPPTISTSDTSPRCPNKRKWLTNEEMPQRSLRLKTSPCVKWS